MTYPIRRWFRKMMGFEKFRILSQSMKNNYKKLYEQGVEDRSAHKSLKERVDHIEKMQNLSFQLFSALEEHLKLERRWENIPDPFYFPDAPPTIEVVKFVKAKRKRK